MARKKAVNTGKTRPVGRPRKSAIAADKKSKGMSSPEPPVGVSPTKKTPRKAAPRGKWSEEQLLTSDKSVLIDADLVKLLASSAAWHCLEEDEKRQILDLLPSDIHPNPDPPADDPNATIPPLPDSFVRYSNNWRDGIRQFQLDLQNGRYDPEWLRQADEARQERENGDFDTFKEREYEHFWGQKQKSDIRLAAGEAAKIKLGTLVEAGVIRVGDVWRLSYCFRIGDERLMIDKETRVQEIDGTKLTFVMPAGRQVFLKSKLTNSPKTNPKGHDDETQQAVEEICPEDKNVPNSGPLDQLCPQEHTGSQPTPTSNRTSADAINAEPDLPVYAKQELREGLAQHSNVEENTADLHKQEMLTTSPLSSPPPSLPPSSPPDQRTRTRPGAAESKSNIAVVIFSPCSTPRPNLKRPTPQPTLASLSKRQRGRPRKGPDVLVETADPEGSEHQTVTDSKDKSMCKDEPETGPGVEPVRPPRQTVQVVLESTPNLASKPQPISETYEAEKNVESATKTESMDTSADTINSPVFQIPGPSDIPMDLAQSTQTDEQHKSNKERTDLALDLKDEHDASLKTDSTPSSSFQHITEPSNVDSGEVIVHDITNPMMLTRKILAVDGRHENGRVNNAWKEIRCYRDNQDMGSLWDIRQAWYLKKS